MKSGQVVTGIINGIADQYETPDILQILPNSKLSILTDREILGAHRHVFRSDRVASQTVVTKSDPDELGRDGILNHTVLYKFDASTQHDGITYIFDYEQFAEDALAGKYNFIMPPLPELKHPLDYPPKMEVTP